MSVAQWHAVPANPRQPRDQIERAPKAKHLHKFVPGLHEEVYMAEDPLGNKCKLTAHTRGEVWFQGLSDAIPDPVQVTVIPVKDMEDAGQLCQFYDSREAVNTSADLIHGALTYHRVPMKSPLLMKSVGLPTPLRYSYEVMLSCYRQSKNSTIRALAEEFPPVRRATAIDFVAAFKDELAALDGLNPGEKRGTTNFSAVRLRRRFCWQRRSTVSSATSLRCCCLSARRCRPEPADAALVASVTRLVTRKMY